MLYITWVRDKDFSWWAFDIRIMWGALFATDVLILQVGSIVSSHHNNTKGIYEKDAH